MRIFKFTVVFLCIALAIGFVAAAAMIIKQNMVDISINDSISLLTDDVKYKNPVRIKNENVPEINKMTSGGFYSEIKNQFPDYKITRYKNIKNSELIDKIYNSLSDNMTVICPYATEWYMNYCAIAELDVPGDRIIVNNPGGHTETYTIADFLKATRFENYEDMEFQLKLGFAAELFTKNTVYILEKAK